MRWFQEMVRTLIPRSPAVVIPDEVGGDWCRRSGGIPHGELPGPDANDVFAFSLASETDRGVMKGSDSSQHAIPVRKSDVFMHLGGEPVSGELHVLQGERQDGRDNKSLGRFRPRGSHGTAGGAAVAGLVRHRANGLLQVSAHGSNHRPSQSVSIQGGSNLSEERSAALLEEPPSRRRRSPQALRGGSA